MLGSASLVLSGMPVGPGMGHGHPAHFKGPQQVLPLAPHDSLGHFSSSIPRGLRKDLFPADTAAALPS